MTPGQLTARLAALREESLPLPGAGATALRHLRLMQIGQEDLTLAKLIEAHWDALAILAEAGRQPQPNALYAVWASDVPGHTLTLHSNVVSGSKAFCSGSTLVDCALVTVNIDSAQQLIELDLRSKENLIAIDTTPWKTEAFRQTETATIAFDNIYLSPDSVIGTPGWYTERPGFWHGAIGPAACWAGGVAGLVDAALRSKRSDPHTLAHLAAMYANIWALTSYLETAGKEIDAAPQDSLAARARALTVRHLIEQTCTDTLRRFARAYGPAPLAMDEDISRRYHEADLYLRQSHAERDLEFLAHTIKEFPPST